MLKTKKILLISHDASRTGAPILLLHLGELLNEMEKVECEILAKRGGDMMDEFHKTTKTTLYSDWFISSINLGSIKVKLRLPGRVKNFIGLRRIRHYVKSFDLIISNTITNGDLDPLLNRHPNVITYVHELDEAIKFFTSVKNLEKVFKHSNSYFYPSRVVRENLLNQYSIPLKKLQYLPYYLPDHQPINSQVREKLRKSLGIDSKTFLLVGMGTSDWRKGADLFIQTCNILNGKNCSFRALWIGSDLNDLSHRRLIYDISKMNISGIVQIIGSESNPFDYLSSADLFFLSSREDPYPLVVIEAAMAGLPTLYFKNSGGSSEFIESDAGFPIEYGRVDVAANKIDYLINNRSVLEKAGLNARKKYVLRHSKNKIKSFVIDLLNYNN